MTLKLNADWVVLSACNTGTAQGWRRSRSGLGGRSSMQGRTLLLELVGPLGIGARACDRSLSPTRRLMRASRARGASPGDDRAHG